MKAETPAAVLGRDRMEAEIRLEIRETIIEARVVVLKEIIVKYPENPGRGSRSGSGKRETAPGRLPKRVLRLIIHENRISPKGIV